MRWGCSCIYGLRNSSRAFIARGFIKARARRGLISYQLAKLQMLTGTGFEEKQAVKLVPERAALRRRERFDSSLIMLGKKLLSKIIIREFSLYQIIQFGVNAVHLRSVVFRFAFCAKHICMVNHGQNH